MDRAHVKGVKCWPGVQDLVPELRKGRAMASWESVKRWRVRFLPVSDLGNVGAPWCRADHG